MKILKQLIDETEWHASSLEEAELNCGTYGHFRTEDIKTLLENDQPVFSDHAIYKKED